MTDEYFVFGCLLLIVNLNKVTCLSCFHCKSEDLVSCMKTERFETCKSELRNPQCLTISYVRVIHNKHNKEVQKTFQKKCVSGEYDCMHWCRLERIRNADQCVEHCCQEDGCNKTEKKKSNSRRNNMNNASTTPMKFDKFLIFLLSTLLFIVHNVI